MKRELMASTALSVAHVAGSPVLAAAGARLGIGGRYCGAAGRPGGGLRPAGDGDGGGVHGLSKRTTAGLLADLFGSSWRWGV